ELDRTIIKALREVVAGHGDVEVVQADILRYDLQAAFPRGGEVATGNIPYNLTGALIRKLLDYAPRPRRLSLVVQKEVAERWTASVAPPARRPHHAFAMQASTRSDARRRSAFRSGNGSIQASPAARVPDAVEAPIRFPVEGPGGFRTVLAFTAFRNIWFAQL